MPNTAPAQARRRAGAVKNSAMLPFKGRTSSKYKPEYCDVVETWGKQGKSKSEIASLLNVDRKTINQWEADFPDFGQAIARALTHAQAWWERKAQSSLGKKHFQAQLWRYSMAGRFKEDYADNGNSNQNNGFDLGALVTSIAQGAAAAGISSAAKPGDHAKVIEAEPVKDDGQDRPQGLDPARR